MLHLVDIILSEDENVRNTPLSRYCSECTDLWHECELLNNFTSDNLYHNVRARMILAALHRYHLKHDDQPAKIPYEAVALLQERDFEGCIQRLLQEPRSSAISSALAQAYKESAFQMLANTVQQVVQNYPGNEWMLNPKGNHLTWKLPPDQALQEHTPVRMDLSHAGWSDIFFLGMDFPEAARVANISIDLIVQNNHEKPRPPITSMLRVIDEPVLMLSSEDLKQSTKLSTVNEVFDFGRDYLGLLKAGVIASGLVSLAYENDTGLLSALFEPLLGSGKGLHLKTTVHDIPKGSRLAVSTNLLASIIAVCMRCSGQTKSLVGPLQEDERKQVAARAILGEWLGGSGGGWQDSGGLWPGAKLMCGILAAPGDPEHGKSRGRLLPSYEPVSCQNRKRLQESLVLVHGGMAQNVGPILQMVTEKYLLREEKEWKARREAVSTLNNIVDAFSCGNIKELGRLLTENFFGPIQGIIPWATNAYTEALIHECEIHFKDNFWGFWMLGGMSGGGMGFLFDPTVKDMAEMRMSDILASTKERMRHSLPFAMEPVVYNFSINENGSIGELVENRTALIERKQLKESGSCSTYGDDDLDLAPLLADLGFDEDQHEKIRSELVSGKVGLEKNRFHPTTVVEDAKSDQVILANKCVTDELRTEGQTLIEEGSVGVVTLAAGVGSRWTSGAGVCKAINPFCKIRSKHRSFLEIHLAKSRQTIATTPHVITTSHMTHKAIEKYLANTKRHQFTGHMYLSKGKSIGLRLVPTVRDLEFTWKEKHKQKLDAQAQKVHDSIQSALIDWARTSGEGSDYKDNVPQQCLHPVGHYYEIPNLLLNGTLHQMLTDQPSLQTLLLHNIDTVGANIDAGLLALFRRSKKPLAFEVMQRHVEDRGGGLACVDGKTRLVEGMALCKDEDEFKCSYYNSMTTWIDIDGLLGFYNLSREDLKDLDKVSKCVHQVESRLPTYVTIKNVKKRWGNGQEDIHPVTQFEKLWGDMSALVDCSFFVVDRKRAQQLKDPAQLDGWLRDGSIEYIESLCKFEDEQH